MFLIANMVMKRKCAHEKKIHIILTLVHLLVLLCEFFINARTWMTFKMRDICRTVNF